MNSVLTNHQPSLTVGRYKIEAISHSLALKITQLALLYKRSFKMHYNKCFVVLNISGSVFEPLQNKNVFGVIA